MYRVFGRTTVWIRHKLNELADEDNYKSFLNDAYHFGWCPDDWTAMPDGVHTTAKKDSAKVMEFASLSTFSNKRGGGHPDVLLMVLDEIIPEDGKYHPNAKMCVKGLLSLAETMTRGREGSCMVACSNFVKINNPYWAKFEIYPNYKYAVTTFPDKGVNIEIPRGFKKANPEDSPLSRLKRAAGHSDYEDGMHDPLRSLVSKVPNGAKPMPYIVQLDGQLYREYYHREVSYWSAWRSSVPNKTVVLTDNVGEAGANIELLPKLFYKRMSETMDADRMRFTDPNVMFKILNLIYEAIA